DSDGLTVCPFERMYPKRWDRFHLVGHKLTQSPFRVVGIGKMLVLGLNEWCVGLAKFCLCDAEQDVAAAAGIGHRDDFPRRLSRMIGAFQFNSFVLEAVFDVALKRAQHCPSTLHCRNGRFACWWTQRELRQVLTSAVSTPGLSCHPFLHCLLFVHRRCAGLRSCP